MENYNIFKIPYSPHFNMGELSSLYLLSMECKRSVEFSNWSFSMQRQLRIAGSYANTLVRNMWIFSGLLICRVLQYMQK